MPFQPGDRIGAYEVLSTLGAGGMGVVYRARDSRLGRDVAIKTLPEAVAADPDRLARFEREARALAALNHPNIATIYGFERADATHFLTMEVVEGATLADRIERAAIPLEQALRIFIQIAEGLEAAHAKGIIHRDLKPANIKICAAAGSGEVRPGAVKILDFGLAKALVSADEQTMAAGASQSPTMTLAATMRGEILGTAAYMSPEQAQGEAADERADIWAFGVCLLEALTGRRVFDGGNASLVLASVLKDEPDLDALPPSTPAIVRRLLRRCLEKKRDRRLHDIADVRLELEEVLAAPPAEGLPVAARGAVTQRRFWVAALVAAALGAGTALLIAAWLRPEPAPAPIARFFVDTPTEPGSGVDFFDAVNSFPAITSDGATLIHLTGVVQPTLRARRVDQLEGAPVRGVEPDAGWPFLSPDDRWIGYYDPSTATIRKISILGGRSVPVCKVADLIFGATWGKDDTIVIGSSNGPLLQVPASGGEPKALTRLAEGELAHRFPESLPGGDALLFVASEGDASKSSIHAWSFASGERKLVAVDGSQPRYAASGHLLYSSGSTLFAVAFDPRRLEVIGDPVPMVEGVGSFGSGSSFYDVAATGALLYAEAMGEGPRYVLAWVDREGREEPLGAPPRGYIAPRLSPDGSQVAHVAGYDIWIWDLEGETLSRLTSSPGAPETGAVWSPDGQTVYFAAQAADGWEVVGRRADGTGETTVLTRQRDGWLPSTLTPDGVGLIVGRGANFLPEDFAWVDVSGKTEPRMLLDEDYRVMSAEMSPDGRWLAYESLESGQPEVFVRPFPVLDAGRWPVSTSGGTRPVWSRDGKELFYLDQRNYLTAVSVEPRGGALSFGRPETLIERAYPNPGPARSYDVSPDGRRFLVMKNAAPGSDSAGGRMILVQNWFDELRRLAPSHGSATR